MKLLLLPSLLATVLLSPSGVRTAAIPDLICREQRSVQIDPLTFETSKLATENTYRIAGGVLFVAEPNRAEYRYNTISEGTSPGVLTSANFTLVSRDETYEGLVTFVHSDAQRIMVSRATCSRQAK